MRIKPLWRQGRQRRPGARRKAWVFAGMMGGALVPLLVVQSQASAYTVFCVGASWAGPNGATMEAANFPAAVPSDIRGDWGGGIPSSDKDSTAVNIVDNPKVTYILYPDVKGKFLCSGSGAAPCVVQEGVTLAYETWESQNWRVSLELGGTYYVSVKATASYGREWGSRQSKSSAITNMVPYKLGDVVQPAHFIEWRGRTGTIKGGYFNTGATCRTGGEYGEQYEWRDNSTGIGFSFDRNIGEGNLWMKETSPTMFQQDYSGQEGTTPTIPE